MKKLFSFLTIIVFMASCNGNQNKKHAVREHQISKSKAMQEIPNAENLSILNLNDAKARYGPPFKEKAYKLNEVHLTEFRITLRNFYSDEEFQKPIPIREVSWKIENDSLVTVWYENKNEKWIPFDTYSYSKFSEF